MITGEFIVTLSAMIDKMGVKVDDLKGKDQKEIGEKIITILAKELYKVDKEFYTLIAAYKGVTAEEAKKMDFVAIIKEIANDTGLTGLFS